MRASMAYLAGAGTVIAAIAAGLGGGVVISEIVSPHGSREPSKLEQRASSQQAQPAPAQGPQANVASNAPGAPVPYLPATQAATTPAVVAPPPSHSPQPVTESNNAAPQAPAPAKAEKTEATASTDTAKPAQPPVPQPSPQAPQQASRDPASSTDNAYAKARDADLKELEAKKKAERAERRQQWAAQRAQQREQERQQREQQRDAEQQANEERRSGAIIVRRDDREDRREDRRPGEIVVRRDDRDGSDRRDFDRPMQFGIPRFNLFGQD
jgi:hypothetical protein